MLQADHHKCRVRIVQRAILRTAINVKGIFKGLFTVGWELRQQHPSDLLSGTGTFWEIIAWLNNFVWNIFTTKYVQIATKYFVWNVFTTKYVQNLDQIERRRLLATIVTSHISP